MPKRKRANSQATKTTLKANKSASRLISDETTKDVKAPGNDDSAKSNDDYQTFTIPFNGKEIICERHGAKGKLSLIFTHGAGGGISNPATQEFAAGFADVSPITLFQGTMNLQSRIKTFNAVLDHGDVPSALGGRSMGARAAVVTAQQQSDLEIKALVLVSFPMVGAQKSDSREQILLDLPEGIDVLFIVGSNDSICDMKHLRTVIGKMKARSWIVEVQGADHGMSIKPKNAVHPMRKETGTIAANWLAERDEGKRYCSLSWRSADEKVSSTGWQTDPVGEDAGSSPIKKRAKPVK